MGGRATRTQIQRLLPREERQIYQAFYLDGKNPYTIAGELGRHLTTVKRCIERLSIRLSRFTGQPHLTLQPDTPYDRYIDDVVPDLPNAKQVPPTQRNRRDHPDTEYAYRLLRNYVLRDESRDPRIYRVLKIPTLTDILYKDTAMPPTMLHPRFLDHLLAAYNPQFTVDGTLIREPIARLRERFDDLPTTHGITDLPDISPTTFNKLIIRLRDECHAHPPGRTWKMTPDVLAHELPYLYAWEVTAGNGENAYYLGVTKGPALLKAQFDLCECDADESAIALLQRSQLEYHLHTAGLKPSSCTCDMIIYWPIMRDGRRSYRHNRHDAIALVKELGRDLRNAMRRVLHVEIDEE